MWKRFLEYRELARWVVSLALITPAILVYALHFAESANPPGTAPSGGLMASIPVYMAHAREHFDDGFTLFYGNPSSPDPATRKVFFQPHTLLLGIVHRVSGLPPGVVLSLFGLISALIMARVAMGVYETVAGLGTWQRRLGFLVFFWGGGVLFVASVGYSLVTGGRTYFFEAVKSIPFHMLFSLDRVNGWWFFNLGRNTVYPTEAWYHVLFLGAVWCALRKRFRLALAIALLASMSHPFTGVELLVILVAWAFLEVYWTRSGEAPGWFAWGTLGILGLHVLYYMVLLNMVPEHRSVTEHNAVRWGITAGTFVPAYILVAALVLWRMRTPGRAGRLLSTPGTRLLLVWAVAAFLLANHEFAIWPPLQPAHFTRGYVWTALFLLGAETLVELFTFLSRRTSGVMRVSALALVVTVFLTDNAAWFGTHACVALQGRSTGLRHTNEEMEFYEWLDENAGPRDLVVSQSYFVGYFATVYSRARSWVAHQHNTPYTEQRESEIETFFQQGEMPDEWRTRPLLVVLTKDRPLALSHSRDAGRTIPEGRRSEWIEHLGGRVVFENRSLAVIGLHGAPSGGGE